MMYGSSFYKLRRINKPRREKSGLRGSRPGATQIGLYDRCDTDPSVQSQKHARSLKVWLLIEEEFILRVAKTRAPLFLHMQKSVFLMMRLKCNRLMI